MKKVNFIHLAQELLIVLSIFALVRCGNIKNNDEESEVSHSISQEIIHEDSISELN